MGRWCRRMDWKADVHTQDERIHLCVPEWERRSAEAAGALVDGSDLYVIGRAGHSLLSRWMPTFDLRPDPIPPSNWYENVRAAVTSGEWQAIKRQVFAAAGRRCQCCGGRGEQWPVECHEEWTYDDCASIQTLNRFIALCPACHEVKHIGLAHSRGRFDIAIRHMSVVTGIGQVRCRRIAHDAIATAVRRARRKWTVDITHMETLRPQAQPPAGPAPAARMAVRPLFGRRAAAYC